MEQPLEVTQTRLKGKAGVKKKSMGFHLIWELQEHVLQELKKLRKVMGQKKTFLSSRYSRQRNSSSMYIHCINHSGAIASQCDEGRVPRN
ncbi:hypothetical protein SKAU_G00057580 [Synaphobranchus kaupii]|uniref:Uncharacterized protein n=1 Tax=Synaphobranchus kaupii TaxID=118154 RepID=A0A9Q1G547_SYNKA|nr:hypothetical protein SKAU_G00057580 [Synaphobranchus kaupii]